MYGEPSVFIIQVKNMPFVAAKCTQCGASLQVDSLKDAANCEHCGSAFIIEKAIQNYNISNAQINTEVVNIQSGATADSLLQLGRKALDIGNRTEADDYFMRALSLDPKNYYAWYLRAYTTDFSSFEYDTVVYERKFKYYKASYDLAPDSFRATINSEIESYFNEVYDKWNRAVYDYDKKIADFHDSYYHILMMLRELFVISTEAKEKMDQAIAGANSKNDYNKRIQNKIALLKSQYPKIPFQGKESQYDDRERIRFFAFLIPTIALILGLIKGFFGWGAGQSFTSEFAKWFFAPLLLLGLPVAIVYSIRAALRSSAIAKRNSLDSEIKRLEESKK